MTDSNRVRVALVKEATLGTTPATPRMRTLRDTGEGLNWTPGFYTSKERRADRMRAQPSKITEVNDGDLGGELSYPVALGALSAMLESAMLSSWISTPERDNDGTADSVITDIQTVANTITFTTGAAFVIGHLVLTSGFALAANNGVFKVTTGGATSLATTAAGWSAEAAPPAAARVKVVGIEGVAGDIVATSTGLTSTTMNFVTMGIVVGMWLKIGGTAAGTRYTGTAANNGWARVTVVSANAITLDNRPAGWAADTGATKTIRIFFGDILRNGTTLQGLTFERAFLGQSTPTYIVQKGMCVDTVEMSYTDGDAVMSKFSFKGMTGSESTSAISGATYAAAPTNVVMTSNAAVGEIRVGGALSTTPNWVKDLTINCNNNLRHKTASGNVGAVDIGIGSHLPTGTVNAYFGSDALLAQVMAQTASSLMVRAQLNSQAFLQTLPSLTFTNHSANAGSIDADVMQSLEWQAWYDSLTGCQQQFDRLEYFET